MIQPVKFDKPYLVIGYDWERCGREGHPPHKIRSDRQLAQKGLTIISQVHQEYDAPFTLFALGKMLEIPELCASLLEELESHHLRSIIDVQGHGYSHRPFKSLHGNNPLGSDEIRHELMVTRSLIKEKLGYEITGLRTPLGTYRGLQGEDDTLRILAELDFAFVSSDLRNEKDLFPSPWYDENGAFRQPYFYDQDKYPNLLEIPTQGWTDNALKGQSSTTKVEVHTLRQELELHLEHLDFALENNLAYTPLCHPWAVATNDEDGFVIRGMLDYALEKGVHVVSYQQLYALVAAFSNSLGGGS
jgi:peptidoglycan/xylan/chitin deacetylase (PgdA/CDA1 family)